MKIIPTNEDEKVMWQLVSTIVSVQLANLNTMKVYSNKDGSLRVFFRYTDGSKETVTVIKKKGGGR